MSYRIQKIIWDVPLDQVQIGIPVGYEVEFSQKSYFNPILYTLSTYDETSFAKLGTFFYSLDDGDTWFNFPLGAQGMTFNTAYKMKVEVSAAAASYIFVEKNGTIYQISADGKELIGNYAIDAFISSGLEIDRQNNLYITGQNKTCYKIDTSSQLKAGDNSLNLLSDPLGIVVDKARNSFWQIDSSKLSLKDLNGDLIFSLDLPVEDTLFAYIKLPTAINKFNGNLCFVGYNNLFESIIFECNRQTKTLSAPVYATKFISSICPYTELSYLVAFSDNWLGTYGSGILVEDAYDTGLSNISQIIEDNRNWYILNQVTNQLIKYSDWDYVTPDYIYDLPNYSERFSSRIILRESDKCIIYSGYTSIYVIRDDLTGAANIGSASILGYGAMSAVVSDQSSPSFSYIRTRCVSVPELDQSSSSSSSSSSN